MESSSTTSYNLRNPAVKRLMKEASELREPTQLYFAQPLEDNLFEWHFTVRGPPDTEFADGLYHGRILLPPDYPMKPPSIMIMTPNGRFEANRKICLSISRHHPESWQPSWSIRTALLAIIGFMPTPGAGSIGSLDYPPQERKILAKKSQEWRCPTCDVALKDVLPTLTDAWKASGLEAAELAQQLVFKDEEEKPTSTNADSDDRPTTPVSAPASSEVREVEAEQETRLRHREDAVPAVSPSFGRSAVLLREDGEGESRTGSFFLIMLVSLMLAALLLRRLYLMNEWRFHPAENS